MSSEGENKQDLSKETTSDEKINNKAPEGEQEDKKTKVENDAQKKVEKEDTNSKINTEKDAAEKKEGDTKKEKEESEEQDKSKDAKSKVDESDGKAKGENDEKSDKEEEEEEDEDEDDEESKKDEKEVPLLDQPVQQSGTRERKRVQRFNEDDSKDSKDKEAKTDIPSGEGVELGEIPRIDASISRFKNDDLKLLHRLLFKAPGKTAQIKKNIRKFNGFDFKKDSEEYNKKIDSAKKFELKQLKIICEMLDLDKKGTKDEISERVLDFLIEPKDSGKPAGGGRPKRTAAVRANNRGYSSHDDSYSSDEQRASRTTRGKGRRLNLKDDSTSESDKDFHLSDASEGRPRVVKRKRGGRKKAAVSDDDSDVNESATSEDSDVEPRKRKKIVKKVTNNKSKVKTTPKTRGRKPAVESEKKTPAKRGRKSKQESSEDSEQEEEEEEEEENVSSSEDEPLIKKAKSPQPPTDEEIKKYVKEILDGANLEEITMKTVCKQVYAHYPDFDLAHKKDFIKSTVKSLIST